MAMGLPVISRCEIKHKYPQSQCLSYQARRELCLISPRAWSGCACGLLCPGVSRGRRLSVWTLLCLRTRPVVRI
eukprot:1487783-Rhodomonas_salina.1